MVVTLGECQVMLGVVIRSLKDLADKHTNNQDDSWDLLHAAESVEEGYDEVVAILGGEEGKD